MEIDFMKVYNVNPNEINLQSSPADHPHPSTMLTLDCCVDCVTFAMCKQKDGTDLIFCPLMTPYLISIVREPRVETS